MKKKYCVYTCIVGYYDSLIKLSFISDDYDYICFTNQKELLSRKFYGPWEIRPLLFEELDPTRNNRWHKILGYAKLGEYSASIYIDANVNILSDYVYNLGKNTNNELLIPRHYKRSCVYDERDRVSALHKEDKKAIEKITHLLEQEKMPHSYGLTENNVIIRNHSSEIVDKIMCEWWIYVKEYAKRDQLSLPVVLWKNGISPAEIMIPNARSGSVNFKIYHHLHEIGPKKILYNIREYIFGKYRPFQPYHFFGRMIVSDIKWVIRQFK